MCIDIGHRYSGTVGGFMNMIGNMGTAVSPPIVNYLAGPNSIGPLFSLGAGATALYGIGARWEMALVYSACMFFVASAGWAFINPKRVIVYTPEDRRRLQEEGAIH